jgi:hypothetical protein
MKSDLASSAFPSESRVDHSGSAGVGGAAGVGAGLGAVSCTGAGSVWLGVCVVLSAAGSGLPAQEAKMNKAAIHKGNSFKIFILSLSAYFISI